MEALRRRVPLGERIVWLRDWFQHFVNYLDRIIRVVLWAGMGLLMFAVVFHVVGRYFFGKTYVGTLELVRYTMIWISLLGASAAFGCEEHIGIKALQNVLSKKSWFWISILGNLLLCIFLVAMLRGGIEITLRNWYQISLAMRIPMFYPYLAVPVGALLMALYVLVSILNSIISSFPTFHQLSSEMKIDKK